MKRSLSLILALSSWGLLATLGMAQQEQQQGAVIVWEVPYEELISGHPISLQVPPIQEDTVLYVLRVRVPEKLSLQQLEQLRKNWAHEVRKEISTMRTHQDTFVVQSYPPKYATIYRVGQDTFGVQYWPPKYAVIYDLDGTPQDTAGAGVDRTRYTGGYFLYALPQDTTKPAELVDYYVPNGTSQDTTEPASAARINIKPLADRVVVEPAPAEERQIAYNAGVEGAIIAERRGNVLLVGNFTPTHVALPMPELELDPGEGPVCGLPVPEEEQTSAGGVQARQYYYHNGWLWPVGGGPALATGYSLPNPQPPPPGTDGGPRPYTGYVLNQAIATGPKPSGKTLGAVTRQAPPQGGNQNMGQAIRQQLADLGAEVEVHRMAGPISLPRPSDVGIPEFRMMPPGGGAPVLWPNGNPPRNPRWPLVGVIGGIAINESTGEVGPATGGPKPQNWCGTEYIWTGPRPKSPKITVNVIGPWSNPRGR
jgi:hypothetical protein